ncbi:putative Clr5 domain-containing protein [Seiridium cardinale]
MSAMSLPVRAAAAPPQRGDWERHKRKIAQLYLEDNKPLREVADIMRIEHDFSATPKMYKQRFHQWDFRKNLKAGEVKKFKGQTASGQETHLPVVHGRKLGSKRLKSLVTKSNKSLSRSPESESSRGSPLPGLINAPDDLRLAERSLQAVTSYSRAQLGSQSWDLARYNNEGTGTHFWSTGMNLAAYRIAEKRDLVANFQVLNKCCDEYRSIVQKQDPLLVWVTYNAILQLSRIGDDIAMSFAKLAVGLSSIHFGRSHPLTILWASVRRMDMKEIRHAALPIIDAQFELFHDEAGPGNTFWPRHTINVTKKLHDLGLLSPEDTHKKLNYTIQWIQENPGLDVRQAEERLNSSRMYIACIYNDCKEYAKADAVLSEVEKWVEKGGCANDNQQVNCIEIRAELDAKRGNLESAEYHYKKALALAQELLWGKDPGRIGFSLAALENFYLDNGNLEAAHAVRQGYNTYLKSMVGEPKNEEILLLEDSKEQGDMSEDSDSG